MARTPLKGSPRIAVIEDDDSVRKALTRLVRSLGMEVEAFASGNDFLQQVRDPFPDCLLLDLNMPGLNGFEVHTRIKGLGLKIPTVFITASVVVEHQYGRATEPRRFLRKPFTDRELLAAIRSAITSRKSTRSVPHAPVHPVRYRLGP